MDLVDEKDISGGEVQQDRAQRALVVDRGTGADLDGHSQLVGDDVRECRLAESGWAAQQDVLHRLVAPTRSLEKDSQVLAHLLLADVLAEEARAKREVVLLVVGTRVENFLFGHFRPSDLRADASASCVLGDAFQSTDSMPDRASCDE